MIKKITEWVTLGRMIMAALLATAAGLAAFIVLHWQVQGQEIRLTKVEAQMEVAVRVDEQLKLLREMSQELVIQGQARQIMIARFEERVAELLRRIDSLERKLP